MGNNSGGEEGTLGLPEVVAMGVGGMVSGGIYAVLGVAMKQSGNAVPIAYLLAGVITLLTAYSYVKLTLHFGDRGGVFSFIEHTTDSETLAGFTGWVLVVGYVGVMAMYAFAFGAYSLNAFRELGGIQLPQLMRPVFSVAVVAAFVGLNILGVEETGFVEDIAVYFKVFLLLSLAVLGVTYADTDPTEITFFSQGFVSPFSAFAIIFVSYEGFQLLTYDYNEIEDVESNLPRGMLLAIVISIVIYVSVSYMATLNLSPEILARHKETALAKAVSNIPFLGEIGFVLVILSAIKSTSSGINATLFGTARLAHRIATEKVLPRVFTFRDRRGIPVYSLVIMGVLTALLACFGSLKAISEFGSVAFLCSYTATNFVNLVLYRETNSHPLIPSLGLVGTVVALPILGYHLYVHEFHVLVYIVVLFVGLFLLEFLYLERTFFEDVVEGNLPLEDSL